MSSRRKQLRPRHVDADDEDEVATVAAASTSIVDEQDAWIHDCVIKIQSYTSIPKVFGCSLNLRVGLTLRVGSSGVNTPSVRVYPASSLNLQSAWTPSPKYESSLTEPARRLMRCIHQVFGCGFFTVLNVNS